MASSNMQMIMKDLQTLKQEETALVNLASKISDQLNRLKVEELALQNMARQQAEELERRSRGSQRSINRSMSHEGGRGEEGDGEDEGAEFARPLDLYVNRNFAERINQEEEEEEDDEEEGKQADDIEQFVQGLC